MVDMPYHISSLSSSSSRRKREPRTTPIKLERSLQPNPLLRTLRLRIRLLSTIQPIHIRLVMFGMMKRHDLFGDVWFERVVGVVQGWEGVDEGGAEAGGGGGGEEAGGGAGECEHC